MLWVLIKMPHWGHSNEYPQHGEAILMSTYNICFYEYLMKIIILLSNHQVGHSDFSQFWAYGSKWLPRSKLVSPLIK